MANNVCLVSGDDYAPIMGVTIYSILKNNSDLDLTFYIVDCGIGDKNKKLLSETINDFGSKVVFIKGESDKLSSVDFNLSKNYPFINTFIKVVFPTLFPDDVDTLLYVDCDILCLGSLKELFDVNISDYYVGACEEFASDLHKSYLNLESNDPYFNAGMLYINLKKWREDNLEDILVDYLCNNPFLYYAEQDIINKLFKNKILKLDLKYNLSTYFQVKDYKRFFNTHAMELVYPSEVIENSQKNPVFVHFNGGEYFRPWFNKNHKYYTIYNSYASESHFGFCMTEKNFPLRQKIGYFLEFDHCRIFSLLRKPDYFKKINENNLKKFYED